MHQDPFYLNSFVLLKKTERIHGCNLLSKQCTDELEGHDLFDHDQKGSVYRGPSSEVGGGAP